MSGRNRSGWRVLLVGLLAAAGVMVAAPAQAHDVLTGTTPASGAQVDQLPGEVVLTFDEPAIAVGTQIIVTGPNGPVQDGTPRLVDNTVHQPLKGGPAGRYAVSWRVTSADGHPVSGSFAFTTTAAAGTAPTGSTSAGSTSAGSTSAGSTSTGTTSTGTTGAGSTAGAQTAAPAAGPVTAADPGGGVPIGAVVAVVVVVALALVLVLAWMRRRGRPPA